MTRRLRVINRILISALYVIVGTKQSPIPGSDYLEFAQIFEFFVFDIRLLGNTGQLGKGSQ